MARPSRPVRRAPLPAPRGETLVLAALCAYLALALLTGGGSRPDILSHLILRPAAVLFAAFAAFHLSRDQLRVFRVPLLLLSALALLMLLQLMPLPPGIWTKLPGRDLFAQASGVFGFEQPWRPITLSPGRTWNSLVALLPPLAAILLVSAVSPRRQATVLTFLIGLLVCSAILGLAQRAGPPDSALYLYRVTNNGSAVGFFANRNHQASMLACLFPMLGLFAAIHAPDGGIQRFRVLLALAVGALLVPLILATGSRSGLVLSAVGIVLAVLLFQARARAGSRAARRFGTLLTWLLVAVGIAGLVALTLILSRADAVERITGLNLQADMRLRVFGTLWGMVESTFPVGIGFGAFEHVFRSVEPYDLLDTSYLNHAHNDLMQLLIEGGLIGAAILAVFLVWFAQATVKVWRSKDSGSGRVQLGRLGSAVVALILLASLVDYPLRTPFVMIVFAVSLSWLCYGTANRMGLGEKDQGGSLGAPSL